MEHPPETNENLIARVKDPADQLAWGEFLATYQPVVLRMARNRGLQSADAEDLAQSVFIAVSSAIRSWEPDGPPFRAWLFKITRNAIVNAVLSRRRHQATGGTSAMDLLEQIPDGEASAEFARESERELLRYVAQQIRNEFEPTTWTMFWETEVVGKSVAEVALSVGRSHGAVYVARCRVMKVLRDRVQEIVLGWEDTVDAPVQSQPTRRNSEKSP
jgi:RNA polymerase sigma-70 factor (ECF subfamily)